MEKIFFFSTLLSMLVGGNYVTAQYKKINVLVYTTPDVYHNQSIPAAITQLKSMAERNFVDLTWTQLETSFTDKNLANYSVIVFLHSTVSKLNAEQEASFKKYIHNGGGFVGIHAASDIKDDNEWYKKLVGRTFIRHPEKQTAVMTVVDKKFPATMHLSDNWVWTDEWYEYGEALTPNLHVLLTVDESTYYVKVGMGKNHPVAWYQEFEGGRSFYTGLGHMESSYNDQEFIKHIYGGIYWAATGKGIVQ
jgi:Uncharacterized protein conserved in bacteria